MIINKKLNDLFTFGIWVEFVLNIPNWNIQPILNEIRATRALVANQLQNDFNGQ